MQPGYPTGRYQETVNTADRDTKNLVDADLSIHSQLTLNVGAAMASAIMSYRQIWPAQTTLPEIMKKVLTNMSVEPVSMFHPDSAKQTVRTRECVQRKF